MLFAGVLNQGDYLCLLGLYQGWGRSDDLARERIENQQLTSLADGLTPV